MKFNLYYHKSTFENIDGDSSVNSKSQRAGGGGSRYH